MRGPTDRPAGRDDDGDEREARGGRDPDGDGGVPAAAAGEGAAEEARGHALDAAPRPHRAQMPAGSLHGSPPVLLPPPPVVPSIERFRPPCCFFLSAVGWHHGDFQESGAWLRAVRHRRAALVAFTG